MSSGRWDLIQTIFDEALGLDVSERDAYVQRASANDLTVLNEVHTLLQAFDSDPDAFERPATDLAFSALKAADRKSLAGETILHYSILRKLGSGGMGEVYLADDLKLNRKVALKFLSPELVHDSRARRQLRHEAQLSAYLDHPNVCKVYDFEETEGHSFIVMQFVKGESLSSLIKARRLDPARTHSIADQIVSAIAAAHESETIHRDIKPGNAIITAEGDVQVLDFGLAKIVHNGREPKSARDYLTNATQKGVILGTVAYMSPEQLKGEELDLRTDIFSLGTVLYELFTGSNPFVRRSDAETIAAILEGGDSVPPGPSAELPENIRCVVERCLHVDRNKRYENATELLIDLRNERSKLRPRFRSSLAGALAAVVFVVAIVLSLWVYSQWRSATGVAVLPFANETADPDLDYLANGLAETIGGRLHTVGGYRSIPYTKVAGLNAAAIDPNSLGTRLRVDLILTGRIFRESGELRVESRLVSPADGRVLRTTVRGIDPEELQKIEDELLEQMFSGLELKPFTVASETAHQRGGTANGEALRQYLIGRQYWRKRDRENLPRAIDAFQKAIDLDPGYARAYAGLADSYILLNSVAYGSMPAKEAFAKARAAAKHALEIDPLDAEAMTSQSVVLFKHDSNWAEAERSFRRAIEIDPEVPSAHYWFSGLLAQTGRADESIAEAEKAKELDPFSPLVEYNLARVYYFSRQYDRSLSVLSTQTAIDQSDAKIQYLRGLNLLQKGSDNDALAIFRQISGKDKMLAIAAEGFTLGKMGWRDEAMKLIADLEREALSKYIPPQEFAFIYIGLGEKERAFEFLNRAADERSNSLSALRVEPLFDSIRDDVRFADLLRKLSLDKF